MALLLYKLSLAVNIFKYLANRMLTAKRKQFRSSFVTTIIRLLLLMMMMPETVLVMLVFMEVGKNSSRGVNRAQKRE